MHNTNIFGTLILIFETLFPFVSGELRPELPFIPSFSNISSTVGSIMHLLGSLPELLTREAQYGVYDAREFQHTFVYRETLMAMNNSQDLTCALGSVLKASNCGIYNVLLYRLCDNVYNFLKNKLLQIICIS